ncbi:hypothetical protein [Christiangramia sp. SM2212]|uniref:Preprotein translocase subunit YajC n=1 Tax=Christiangramia sediminicola TaxID=3073267 RepID=A0ABU1ETE2_9FLAO|nr:hypothetical protein [Christiangramia sp. SM2212]MDR5591433.1 hypothetical protein [Christiangramia sp. SM2212]
MDKSSIMIGTFLLVIFMFPILYVLLKQKSREAKFKKELNKLASENGLVLDRFETFGHLSLGLDSTNKKLVVIDPKSEIDHEVIDLKKVNKINLAKRTQKGENRKERIIHLGIEIAEMNSPKLTEIVFYDEDDYESTDAEIRLHEAKKWDDLLHKNLAI